MNLFNELAGTRLGKLDRKNIKVITFDTVDGRPSLKDQKEVIAEQTFNDTVKQYLAKRVGQITSAAIVANDLGTTRQSAANAIAKFWRAGLLDSRRQGKKMFYMINGGFDD